MPLRVPENSRIRPALDIHSRRKEESQVVLNWLNRLHECLRADFPGLYQQALAGANISAERLRAGDGLTHAQFDRVIEIVRRSVPDVFFRFMSVLELTDLGMLGYAVLSCPNLGKGMELLARYLELTSDRFVEHHEVVDDCLVISPSPTSRHIGEDRSIAEDCIAGNWRSIVRMISPNTPGPGASIQFAFPEPDYHDVIERFFDPCPVEYAAERSALSIPVAWFDLPLQAGNGIMSDMTASVCERVLGTEATSRQGAEKAVRQLLLSRPGRRMLRLDEAAEKLAMSTAQLRKRLYRRGTSYKSIVLEVRMNLALQYLQSTHLSVQEIAYLLDYAQPGPFSRAFKKCFGVPPVVVRKQSLRPQLLPTRDAT